MKRRGRHTAFVALGAAALTVIAACGSSSSGGGTQPTSSATSGAASVPSDLSISSFDVSFSYLSKLQPLTAAGKGLVGVILPDTTSSTRYVDFDAPYLAKAFKSAGYSKSQYKIDNAQGVDATELADAQADISLGAKVLIFDPIDSTVGGQIQQLAASHGVAVISYDRATFTGTNTYYVSFDNVQVGKLIGQGFKDCVTSWGVKNPKVFQLDGGEDTDPNAVSFAQGYNSAIWGKTKTPLPAGTTNSDGVFVVRGLMPGAYVATAQWNGKAVSKPVMVYAANVTDEVSWLQ